MGAQFRPTQAALSHHSGKSPDQPSLWLGGGSMGGEGKSLTSIQNRSKVSLLSDQVDSASAVEQKWKTSGAVSAKYGGSKESDGFVPDQVLHQIQSIDCLEDKMNDISSNCHKQVTKAAIVPTDESYCSTRKSGELLSISTYPHFS